MLDEMIRGLRLAGYAPNTASQIFAGCDSLEDDAVEEEKKELAVIFLQIVYRFSFYLFTNIFPIFISLQFI